MSARTLTEPQIAAVQWLFNHGGTGVIDNYGGVIAGGNRRSSSYAATFLRLFTTGYLESDGPGRLKLSSAGEAVAVRPGNPTDAVSKRDWTDPRIREAYIGDEDTVTDFGDPA